jgi:hypothetical protein
MIQTLQLYIAHSVHCLLKNSQNSTKRCTIEFLKYLRYNTTLNIPTFFDLQGIIIREPNRNNTTKQTLQQLRL